MDPFLQNLGVALALIGLALFALDWLLFGGEPESGR